MPEKESIFSSKVKYKGVFSFKDLYSFCYQWLTQENGFTISEDKYDEKIAGDSKEISVSWKGTEEVTDYFKYEIAVSFTVSGLKNVEVTQGGAKVATNNGGVEISVKGTLVKDYKAKFEMTAFNKFLRGTYEKYVIPSRIEEYQGKLSKACEEFLEQAKAYLALEGKK